MNIRLVKHKGSHPSWVRGLKPDSVPVFSLYGSRTLRGCVD